MPTAIDMLSRRDFLTGLVALLSTPAWSRTHLDTVLLAATWQLAESTAPVYQVGILTPAATQFGIRTALDVPTRAHGLLHESGGSLLAVARRPGNWLLRWNVDGKALAWHWAESGRVFNGHVLASADGRTLYTTETDTDTGMGLLGVREARSLEKLREYPTHGIDPHQLLWDMVQPRQLIVANGGVPTQPETGRVKRNLEHMDASLVRIDAASGALLGQWRLADRRLSLRHLAWGQTSAGAPLLGIALQAEHDTPQARAAAPVLALFDGQMLRPATATQDLAGYGGDIAAAGGGFVVSCPRAQNLALFGADGTEQGLVPLAEACALIATRAGVWAGGRDQVLALMGSAARRIPAAQLRLDNHWVCYQ